MVLLRLFRLFKLYYALFRNIFFSLLIGDPRVHILFASLFSELDNTSSFQPFWQLVYLVLVINIRV
jgi:hypothetical protein